MYDDKPGLALSVAILAGGRSSRMGRDKTQIQFQGRPLLAHTAARVAGLGCETMLITNYPDAHRYLGLPMFQDIVLGHKGPLVGIYTALIHAAAGCTLVIAADMPFVNRDLIGYMAGLAEGFDVVVPRLAEGLEGLHAIYSKACLPAIRARLEAGQRKLISFYTDVQVRYVEAPEIDRFDPQRRSFFNVNTPEDLEVARRML